MRDMDPEILKQRKKMQVEIMLKEADLKRAEREKLLLEVEIRAIKSKQQQLAAEFGLKDNKAKKAQQDFLQIQNELIKLKHKFNLLH